ncbi:MAG: hypothetical protein O3A20_07510 [Planctomycetota bacterium]|nr:hypothetical protein [Planctomycetota bacterium]
MIHAQSRVSRRALRASPLLGLCLLMGCLGNGKSGAAGSTTALTLDSASWGRLVRILDQAGLLVESEVMIHPELTSQSGKYLLTIDPATQEDTLRILATSGSATFDTLRSQASAGLPQITEKTGSQPAPFSRIARNAAIRLEFSRALDASTVNSTTIQIFAGNPPTLAFTGRYVVKEENGKGVVYVDPTVTALQAANSAIPQNAVGFPAAQDTTSANLIVRVPTEPDPLAGQPLALKSIGGLRPSLKSQSEAHDTAFDGAVTLVRAMRTGNETEDYRGFLRDDRRPNLIGVFNATINSVISASATSAEFTFTQTLVGCRPVTPKVGDLFEVGTSLLVTTQVLDNSDPANYRVMASVESGGLTAGASNLGARYTTRYDVADAALQVCFLQIQPVPFNPPSNRIDPHSTITIRFDEPVDPDSVTSMGTFVITSFEDTANPNTKELRETAWFRQSNTSETVGAYIDRQRGYDLRLLATGTDDVNSEYSGRIMFGPIEVANGSTQFTLSPIGGFSEVNPDAFLAFAVSLREGPEGIRDLAGNPLELVDFVAGTPGQTFQIQPLDSAGGVQGGTLAQLQTSYYGFFGGLLDENEDGLAEYAGQVTVDPGKITSRPPSRFSRAADVNSQSVGARSQGTNQPDPLNPAGAVTMHAYRPQDFGFGYPDPSEHNMDVEGFAWSPASGVVFDETYPIFTLSVMHGNSLPDEAFDPVSQLPIWPGSGMTANAYDDNILGFPTVDEVEVFRSVYAPRSINLYSQNGVIYLPFPAFEQSYTWRDTSIPQTFLGGTQASIGSPNQQYLVDNGLGAPFWAPETVPSIGLSLLLRFRCYPFADRLGLNQFTTTQMQPTSALPAFRMFSAGGQDGSSQWFRVQPDNPSQGGTAPSGGFLPGGARTPTQFDTLLYWLNSDFVVRVSRVYTHWFDFGDVLDAGAVRGVILEPENPDQPSGTSLLIEYRGSVQVDHMGNPLINPSPLTTADLPFDGYGDSLGIGTVSTPGAWTTNFADLEGQQFKYFQVRVTFIANADLGTQPKLDGLGIAIDLE